MAPPLIISVMGESTINRTAERGVLSATVKSSSSSQDSVSDNVTKTCNQIRDTLVKLASKNKEGFASADAPVTLFTIGGVTTSSYIPRDKDNKELPREFTATTSVTAIFRDFTKLGEVTSSLLRMPYVEVAKTQWRLTDATLESLGSESRKMAMQDAIKKAGDYASVLGRTPVAIEVSDSGARYYGGASQELAHTRGGTSGSQIEGMTLEPEDVKVMTGIDVKFQAN
ncbi:MAG: hypothetical protein Q9170_004567 [Blastenia crenularia]